MNYCVVGLQWGDEGKGKVVDILARDCRVVVRYAGGANAGHTVVIDGVKFALHLLPSGVLRDGVIGVIANAVVVDPEALISEIDGLADRGIDVTGRLLVSENAHMVMEYHKLEDRLQEQALGKGRIGTTARGIGPCYADKAGRSYAIRMCELRDLDRLRDKIRFVVGYKNKVLAAAYGAEPLNPDELFERCRDYARRLVGFLTDTTEFLHQCIAEGKSILFEGAQGSLLDIDHGTYPFVTSSNCSLLGMPAGSGVSGRLVDVNIGVCKAYTTRVGEGPFPTELADATGEYIRQKGHEYGTTTGRPRRCGWYDAVAAAYSVRINAIDQVALMHLDTLTGLAEIKVCKAYRIADRITTFLPANVDKLNLAVPVYESLPGWQDDIAHATRFEQLPLAAQRYVLYIESLLGRPISMIGVGPGRDQIIFR